MKSILNYVSVTLLFVLAFFGAQLAMANGGGGRAIVGIDYGTTNVRMGMLRSGVGSVEIVLSFESDRKTINAVAYREESILFSQTAMNMFPKFPKAIFCRMNQLLGKFFSSPSVKEYRQTFIHEIAEDPVRKTVLIAEPVHGHLVPIEEIAATFFTHLMDQAEMHAGFKVVDCVISVPAYFDHFERQAVLDAAKIAGFNVLSLINSVSAAALFKTTTTNDLTVPTNFIIYDSGSGGTSAALVKIDPKKTVDGVTAKSMEILGLESDSGLGGDLIDDRIASFLISKFEAMNPGIKVTSGKPRNKVLIEASRIKKILNANDRAMASLEDLIDDYGISVTISRDDIDNLLKDLAPRFSDPISNLLSKNKMSLDEISAILMIGGNSRHQFLLKSLKSSFGGDKISVTLDPDESIVKGATLYGAKVHPAFRLRPTHFMDISPSGIYLQYREIVEGGTEGEMKRVELFPEVSPLQTRKSLTLKKINHALVDLFYSRSDQKIGTISVQGFNDAVEKVASSGKLVLNSKMRIPVLLSSSGHVVIESPVAAVEYEETISKKVYKTHTKTTTTTATSSTTATPTPTTPSEKSEPSEATITPTPTPTEKVSPPEVSVETQTIEEKVKKSKTFNLPHEINFAMPPMDSDSISKSQKTIGTAREKEFERTKIANARNDLEKAVYRIQGELNSVDFLTYASNSERSTAKNQLSKISKFLAEEASDKITAEIYLNHLYELVKIEGSVKRRQHEEQERPVAIEALQLVLNSVNEFITTQKAVEPSQRPQTDEDLAEIEKKTQEITKWLLEKTKKQASTAKNVDPVLLITDLELKKSELSINLALLKAKKMPVKPEEPKEPEAKTEESSGQATAAEGTEHEENTEGAKTEKPAEGAKTEKPAGASEESSKSKTTTEIPEDLVDERFEL
jgi:hypoxia up-regulated 1